MGLNYANLDKLIAALSVLPASRFQIDNWFTDAQGNSLYGNQIGEHDCGTAACIAGWSCVIRGARWREDGYLGEARHLGLTPELADELFTPRSFEYRSADYPLARALDVLRHLRATGEVDWDRFPYENYVKPKAAWTPPVAVEVRADLPAVLTSLLRPNVATEPV